MSDGTVQRWDAYVQTEGAEPHVDWIEDADGGVVTYDDHKAIVDALRTQAAQPVWSKDKPTVSGEYWHRGVKSDDPVVVRVMAAGKKLLVLYPGDPLHYTLPQDGERGVSGEWAPILLPREA